MRYALAFSLFCMAPRWGWAISPPLFPNAVKPVQRLLDASNQLDDKVLKKEIALREALRNIDPDRKVIAQYEKDIVKLKQERDLKRNVAIHEALRV